MKIKDKVLIVEDEQSISNFISMILQASDFDTIVVRTGEEALTMISGYGRHGGPQVRAQVVQSSCGGGFRPEP